jgi:diguanylate cyclase (GGDEF)-like protein
MSEAGAAPGGPRSGGARARRLEPPGGVLDRQVFDERARQMLASARAPGTPHVRVCALVCIGLDRFQLLNRVYGRRIGDEVLDAVGARLREVIGAPHLLGWRGGDEFVALLVGLQGAAAVPAAAAARRAIDAVMQAGSIGALEVSVSASAGVAVFPDDGLDLDALLNAGDTALFRAKAAGGGTLEIFTLDMARRAERRLRVEQRLRKAYQERHLHLAYQPLVDLPEANLIGAEALLRWDDAELGHIGPGDFIPVAEECGLIDAVGGWVLREACRQRQAWRRAGLELPPIAINVSGVQLRNRAFVDAVLQTLDEFEVGGEELEIEITETGLMDRTAFSRDSLRRLSDAGIKAALDDFGVGYSSLAHLRDLPMHRLKIDRSFTVACMRDARTLTIVKSVIDMAHSLGMTVTAEGIETEEQRAWMHELGCDSAQGFLFARPMAAPDFVQRFLDGPVRDAAAAPRR